MSTKNIKVGITQGDINGIGYEIIIKALSDNRIYDNITPIVYGSPKVFAYHRKALNIENFSLNNIKGPEEAMPKKPYIINCNDDNVKVELGKSSPMAGEAALAALERAVNDLKNKKIDVLVTAPINKENIQSPTFKFPGHTEYLMKRFDSSDSLMLMISDKLRIGTLTGHVPLSKVSTMITIESVISKLKILNKTLIEDFAIRKPKIAILGLNPHAGDNGLLGKEETEIIIPAMQKAGDMGMLVFGPYPSDGFFGTAQFLKFDAVLSMYHDQGLTAFKAISFEDGVNYTAGLPFIRTSPCHGTAFELVGKNLASENSMRQAIYSACDIYFNREKHSEITQNPLPVYDKSNLV